MWTCKQVSRALHDRDYASLPLLARLGLHLHVALCIFCGRANRQIMAFYDVIRRFRHTEEHAPPPEQLRLPLEARARLHAALQRAASAKDPS